MRVDHSKKVSLDLDTGTAPETSHPRDQGEIKRMKGELSNALENINRIVDHILAQPVVAKDGKGTGAPGLNKLKAAMEAISFLNAQAQAKDRELKELRRDRKKTEYRLDIVEKEKNLMKQQFEVLQNFKGSVVLPGKEQHSSSRQAIKRKNSAASRVPPHLLEGSLQGPASM